MAGSDKIVFSTGVGKKIVGGTGLAKSVSILLNVGYWYSEKENKVIFRSGHEDKDFENKADKRLKNGIGASVSIIANF